jgi:SAM-dependent methyltransferase
MFDKIAKHYDLIMSPFDYRELVDCLDDLIVSCGGIRTDVLSLGCGTSEELVYFMQLGYRISGIDLSPAMIEISKEKLKTGDFRRGDIRKFITGKKYDNIICVFDTVNYLTEMKDLSNCFASVNKALNAGGLFLFDFNSVYGMIHEWDGVRIEETDDFFISYDSKFDLNSMILKCRMKFFVKEKSGKFDSFEETHYERGYTPEEMRDVLKKNGFKLLKLLPFLSRRQTRSSELDRYQIAAQKIKEI